jgi:hypothetical protein
MFASRACLVAALALVVLHVAPSVASTQSPRRTRISIYGGPETGGFNPGAESAMRRAGWGDTSPAQGPPLDCGFFCLPTPAQEYPVSFEEGSESALLVVSVPVRRVWLNAMLGDGAGGEVRGYRSGSGTDVAKFAPGKFVSVVASVGDRLTLGIGPALLFAETGDKTRSRSVRPGAIGDLGLGLIHMGPVAVEARVQLRLFAPTDVVTSSGQRYSVAYRSTFFGVGLGVRP